MKHPMRKIAAACLFSLFGSYAWCVPAKPGLIVYHQPDGTELSVRLVGDEFSHYYMSEDGLLLLPDNNRRLCYAYVTPDGSVQASALQAREVLQRTDRELGFIETQNQSDVLQRFLGHSKTQATMQRAVAQKQRAANPYPTTGKQKVLVILAEYTDVKFTTKDTYNAFNRLLNEEGYSDNGATGSARDYYMASSGGHYEPEINVYGPVQLPHEMAYYGGNAFGQDIAPYKMIADACKELDNEVEFSEYDLDEDGFVDNVYLFYAGYGEAESGLPDTVWPHQYHVLLGGRLEVILDGVYIDRYACSNELSYNNKQLTGIGTFCHEFGHVLGLADHYSTSYQTNAHPDNWDIMASGSYLNSGKTPPLMSAFERVSLNWLEPEEIHQTDTTFVLPPLSQNKAYRISTDNSNEYFLLENRQQTGWDTYIPGHGMLVWHIDYNPSAWSRNVVNDDPNHQYVDIEEADGMAQGSNRTGNPFPGTSSITEITSTTKPNLTSWSGKECSVGIYNIYETADSLILFDAIDPSESLPAVKATAATEVSPVSFRANWNAVDNATSYIIDVYEVMWVGAKNQKKYANGYLAYNVGNNLSCVVTGLKPDTKYFYHVRARGEKHIGDYSQPIEVRTSEKDYRFFAPEVGEATQVSGTSFVANWSELAESERYNVSVYTIGKGELAVETADFEKGAVVPTGWKSNVYSSVSNEGYYGKAPNAIFMNRDKGYVSSPMKEENVEIIRFWYRASEDSGAENKLNIYGMNKEKEWVLLDTVTELVSADGGENYELDCNKFSTMYYAARIEFERPSVGKVAIDDIEIGYRESTLVPMPEYTLVEVRDALSLTVEGLQPETFYAYHVRGNNGVLDSEFSSLSYVRTTSATTLSDVLTSRTNLYAYVVGEVLNVCGTTAGTPIAVFDVSGRPVAYVRAQGSEVQLTLPADGIYLVRVGEQTLKAVR